MLLGIIITITISYVVLFIFLHNNNSQYPLIKQYFHFIFSIFSSFGSLNSNDLKTSFNSPIELFFFYYQYSLFFVGVSFVLSLFLGFIIGIFLAYKNGKISDITISFIIFSMAAIPTFILAPIALIIASINDLPISFINDEYLGFSYTLLSLLIPIALLSFTPIAYFATTTKNNMLEILSENYITVMKSMGQSTNKIFWKGIFKNLFASEINQIVPILLLTISFGLIIERIFQIPGQSLLFTTMFQKHEIDVIMTIIAFKAFLIFLIAFFCEIVHDVIYLNEEIGWNNLTWFQILYKKSKIKKVVL